MIDMVYCSLCCSCSSSSSSSRRDTLSCIQWEWHTAVDVVGGYDAEMFSRWGYKTHYWSPECTCITACRSKQCVRAHVLGILPTHRHTHTHTLPCCLPLSVSLDGSFNESQFPTARHITPLNDLINQARHLLSLAISLFTIASSAVTQFSFLALSLSTLHLDHRAMPWHLFSVINFPPFLSNLFLQSAITCL